LSIAITPVANFVTDKLDGRKTTRFDIAAVPNEDEL
jgi:hypothetical protein